MFFIVNCLCQFLFLRIVLFEWTLDILTKDNLTKSTIWRNKFVKKYNLATKNLTKSTIWLNIFGERQFNEYKFAEKTIWRYKFDEK